MGNKNIRIALEDKGQLAKYLDVNVDKESKGVITGTNYTRTKNGFVGRAVSIRDVKVGEPLTVHDPVRNEYLTTKHIVKSIKEITDEK